MTHVNFAVTTFLNGVWEDTLLNARNAMRAAEEKG